jgi:pilus assembly protein FimV
VDSTENTSASKSEVASLDDEFTLDFELDDSVQNKESVAEDLSHISLALDGLDDDGLPDDVVVSAREEEFSFDFNDLDDDISNLAKEVDSIKSSEFNEEASLGDDFNLEMDVNNLDLAALDNEMASFDAELDLLDDAQDKTIGLAGGSLAAAVEFNVDEFEGDSAEIDAGLQAESLADLEADLEADLDADDFAWEESEVESELAAAVEQEFSVAEEEFALDDDDDFDIDSVAMVGSDTNFEALDAEFVGDGAEQPLNLDVEPEIDLDNVDTELEKQSFAELEAVLDAEGSDIDDSLDLDESMFDEDLIGDSMDAVAETESIAFDESAPLLNTAEEELADDDVFDQALSEFSAESLALNEEVDMSEEDMDAELDFMADADEAATKLDLARAYMDMGDNDGARDILAEVAHEGNDEQRQEAVDLLSRIDA